MCSLCGFDKCPSGCPNYVPAKTNHYCSICGEEICEGEEYIVNDDDEYAHWECISYGRDLVVFLGYDIKTMEER